MHQNIQQAQQLLSTINQMASQMRQQEASNRQLLSQIEQRENQAEQQLSQMQQMCQECNRILQSTATFASQQFSRTIPVQGSFQQGFSAPSAIGSMSYQTPGLSFEQIDPATMGAFTYSDPQKQIGGNWSNPSSSTMGSTAGQGGLFGGQGASGAGINMEISSLPTQTTFASPATMSPDKYQSASQKLGGSSINMSTIGQQAGISSR